MPHYADGTEAKVGDQVTGKLYNSEGIKAGVIVSVTPGAKSCNVKVQFCEALPIVDGVLPKPPRMHLPDESGFRQVKGHSHGSCGPEFLLFVCADYCATSELTKVG